MKKCYKAVIVFLCVSLLTLCAFSVSVAAEGVSNNSNGIITGSDNANNNNNGFPGSLDHFGDRITESELYGDLDEGMGGMANNGRGRSNEGNLAGDNNGRLIDDENDNGVYDSYAGDSYAAQNSRAVGNDTDGSGINYLGMIVGALIALGVLGVVIYLVARRPAREE